MLELLSTTDVLGPDDTKSQFVHEFTVTENASKLVFEFHYNPKNLEDELLAKELIENHLPAYLANREKSSDHWRAYLPLKNLLTLSIEDAEVFRGAAHRHPNEQTLFIERFTASPGLQPGPLRSGVWKVTISAHAVITPSCEYTLRVCEEG